MTGINYDDRHTCVPIRSWNFEETNSSSKPAFSASTRNLVCLKELSHRGSNFNDVGLERKMSCVKELNLRVRQVPSKRFRPGGNEEGVVLAPDREQRRLRLPKVFLEFRVELYVRRIVQK